MSSSRIIMSSSSPFYHLESSCLHLLPSIREIPHVLIFFLLPGSLTVSSSSSFYQGDSSSSSFFQRKSSCLHLSLLSKPCLRLFPSIKENHHAFIFLIFFLLSDRIIMSSPLAFCQRELSPSRSGVATSRALRPS